MLNERQKYIIKRIRQLGHVQVMDLAESLKVTSQTIRRDLAKLCSQGLATRTHGGARHALRVSVKYERRRQLEMNAKDQIAHQASKLISDGHSVAINIGTTTEKVAQALKYHKDLTVITNNINVVDILRLSLIKSLIIVGGEVRPSDGAIVGSEAIEAFSKYKVDVAIIGASSLDSDGAILDFDQREVAVSRAILSNARQRILVCDGSKFAVSATYRICHIQDLDVMISNALPPAEFIKVARCAHTELIITEGK